ncbi:aspartate 1-decarboxylase [Rhizobium leguminosarum]|uniref:aspartate 1-decarboxylase n=1 Tax=Rhizobium leguminosarum TaxID=384 RepID=UPI0024A97223|nr:aspartate 1-decarboxylase [Rhizobium leguminosarum]MDI5929530.1 aspartate 1-decarboxylase [Rhizobium leguminosarum]
MRKLVAGKLHGIHVTEANLNYHGSITLDPDHCEQAGILPMEFVEIWNKNSGERISTYVILGERGSRCCVLNGAAARTCQPGDQVIICNSIYLEESNLTVLKPKVLTFDANNNVMDRLSYSVSIDANASYRFEILDDTFAPLSIPHLVSGVS